MIYNSDYMDVQAHAMDKPALRREPLPPHILDMLRMIPYFEENLEKLPEDELWKEITRIVKEHLDDVPPHVLDELIHEPFIHEMFYEKRNGIIDERVKESLMNAGAGQPYRIDANVLPAWEISWGEGVAVAVIDTGIDIAHEDLAENIWINTLEIPGNGIDDDGNGYIDDVNGWNFCDNSGSLFDSDNPGEESHGTHIAGIIAAKEDNGKGIAGVAPRAKIMPLKVFKNGMAYTSDIIEAIRYAEAMGASIVNCSWGTTTYNQALQEAMEESGMLFVCAAGNSGSDNDANPVYPASFGLGNNISTASINAGGNLSVFSNYGQETVHVSAPGENIISTAPGNNYTYNNGTSMAAAMVSGEAALLLAEYGNMSAAEMRERIISCCDRLSTLTGIILVGNKINCVNVLNNVSSDEIIYITGSEEIPGSSPIPPDTGTRGFNLFSEPTVEGQFIKVAAGWCHSLALKEDGTVWACGNNFYGQLGSGESEYELYPKWVFGTPPQTEQPIYYLDKELKYIFAVINTENLNNKTFTVEYDEDELDVVDLCAFTNTRETGTGTPEGTNVTIIQSSPGIIRFQVNLDIPQGKKWSGMVNIITLKCNVSHRPTISYIIE